MASQVRNLSTFQIFFPKNCRWNSPFVFLYQGGGVTRSHQFLNPKQPNSTLESEANFWMVAPGSTQKKSLGLWQRTQRGFCGKKNPRCSGSAKGVLPIILAVGYHVNHVPWLNKVTEDPRRWEIHRSHFWWVPWGPGKNWWIFHSFGYVRWPGTGINGDARGWEVPVDDPPEAFAALWSTHVGEWGHAATWRIRSLKTDPVGWV